MRFMKILASFIGVLFFYIIFPISIGAAENIPVQDKLSIEESTLFRTPLTNSSVHLYGPEQEKDFYYEIQSTPEVGDHQLVLNIKHSQLLIEPSAVTVLIDDEPIMSQPLVGEKPTEQLIVPLTGNALKEGFHKVAISFFGVVKEGVCVVQNSSANWVTIAISSYIQLTTSQNEVLGLEHFHQYFTGSKTKPVTVVLPQEASIGTIDSGMRLAAHLLNKAGDEQAVKVLREEAITQITGPIILVGPATEFSTGFVQKLFKDAKLPKEKERLILSHKRLVEGEQQTFALFVTGDSAETIQKRINVLLDEELTEQLVDMEMVIDQLPAKEQEESALTVPFKAMNIPKIDLTEVQSESETYFYYIPTRVDKNKETVLTLQLKRSETIDRIMSEDDQLTLANEVELVVYINGEPHSVDITRLTEEENDIYTVDVSINPTILNENHLVSVQFKATGLMHKSPCYATDAGRWIHLLDQSTFTFPRAENLEMNSLAPFPYPFADEEESTLIVLPEALGDDELFNLYQTLQVSMTAPMWTVVRSSEIDEDSLGDTNLLVVGSLAEHPYLATKKEDLIVEYEDDFVNLKSHGFLQEAVKRFAFIQKNPWNQEKTLMTIGRLDEDIPFIEKSFLNDLVTTDTSATIAVQLKNNKFLTNENYLTTENSTLEIDRKEPQGKLSIWLALGFIGLILFIVIAMIITIRRQKKRA